MTSIELVPLVSDAADRLARAIRSYEQGATTLRDAYETSVSVYGTGQALTSLVLGLEHVTNWPVSDRDLQGARERYDGPLVPGHDLALAHALRTKLGLPTDASTE